MTRDLAFISIALLLWGLGEGMFINFITLYIREMGAMPLQLGAILSGVGIAMTVVHLPAGYLADKWGPRRIILLAWVWGLVSGWGMALANSLPAFVIGFVFYGFTTFVSAPMSKYVTAASSRWSAAQALSTTIALYNSGAVIGPLAGGWIAERWGLQSIFYAGSGIFILSTGFIFFIRHQPVVKSSPERKESPVGFLRNPQFMRYALLLFFGMFIAYLPQQLSPNYLEEVHHLSYSNIGVLAALGNLGSVLLLLGLGRLKPRLGFILAQGCVLVFSALLWLGTGMPYFALGYLFLGGYRASRSLASALIRPLAGEGQVGLAFGVMETLVASGVILAPLLAGALFTRDPRWIYILSLGLGVGSILINLRFLPGKSEPAKEPIAAAVAD